MWKKLTSIFLTALLGVFIFGTPKAHAQSLSLFTPYSGITVTPGEDISYAVQMINDTGEIQNIVFALENLPDGWDYSIRAGGKNIRQLSVRANSEEEITVEVKVPLEVDKGEYRFNLVA